MARPTALVTGAARRLGAAFVEALVADGFNVLLHHRGGGLEAQALAGRLSGAGGEVQTVSADLTVEAERARLVPEAMDRFGRLDLLVNNASLFRYDTLETVTADSLADHLAANVTAPVLMIRDFLTGRGEAVRGGLVVNLLDQKVVNPNPDFMAYTASRMALHGLIKPLAQAAAAHGVRVNAIAPGLTLPSAAHPDADFQAGARATPLGYASRPEDLVTALRYLVANPAVTGQTLVVDGGESLTGRPRDIDFDQTPWRG